MKHAAELIQSLAALLWPLVVAGLIVVLLPTLRNLIGHSDSINVEVAGAKVSVQRASEEVRRLINDLQDRVNDLEADRDDSRPVPSVADRSPDARRSVLWVDDRLEANVYERARLHDEQYRVMQAESTTTALNLLQSYGPFDVIISDMGRIEAGGHLNARAGLDLLRRIRQAGDSTPVIFYSSDRGLAPVRAELDRENGVSYTTSPSELMRLVGVAQP